MTTLKCLVCSLPITGRRDKKYCSDQCRFLHNNKKKNITEEPILTVNRSLRKNRSILKSLCQAGKATVRKELMDSLGFDFNRFTNLYMTNQKQVYYLCYDYGFTPLIDKNGIEKALIISKQEYMNNWNPWRFVKQKTV